MADEVWAKWGRIDVLVNNAGTTKFCAHNDLEGLVKEDFLRIYSTNLVGPYQMIRAVAPKMKSTGQGVVVNIASIAGVKAIGSSVAYCASKAALINMTVALARVLGPEIRLNAICPGFIQGEWLRQGMGEDRYEKTKNFLEERLPLRMTATPEMIASTVRYFIEDAVLVTGETLLLDGDTTSYESGSIFIDTIKYGAPAASWKNPMSWGCSKMFRCKARKNRIARRIWKYVERCGLQRNPASPG